MLTLVSFLLAAFGLIYVITESVVFARVRILIAAKGPLAEAFVYCASCTGFWIGFALSMAQGELALGRAALAGLLVVGAVNLVRAFAPHFLPGALDREREIIQAWRAERKADSDPGVDADGA